ncbi:MAG: hypothetical protein ACK56F_14930, partial [bacterium]
MMQCIIDRCARHIIEHTALSHRGREEKGTAKPLNFTQLSHLAQPPSHLAQPLNFTQRSTQTRQSQVKLLNAHAAIWLLPPCPRRCNHRSRRSTP